MDKLLDEACNDFPYKNEIDILKNIEKNQEKEIQLLSNLLNIFMKYDKEYNEELLKEHSPE